MLLVVAAISVIFVMATTSVLLAMAAISVMAMPSSGYIVGKTRGNVLYW
jgi:hypothetical protein